MSNVAAVIELQDTLQPLREIRDRCTIPELDRFIFNEQAVTPLERAARLRCIAVELDLTASHLRRLLETTP